MATVLDTTKNVFQKNPAIGHEILIDLLMETISVYQAVDKFAVHGVKVNRTTVGRHINKIRDLIHKDCNSTSSLVPVSARTKKKPHKHTDFDNDLDTDIIPSNKIQQAILQYEKNIKGIKEVDPIKLLDKNLLVLELMLSDTGEIRERGAIIELEMKIADKLQKMRPSKSNFDLNTILRRNDWSTEFIIQQSMLDPGNNLKEKWLEFLAEKQENEV